MLRRETGVRIGFSFKAGDDATSVELFVPQRGMEANIVGWLSASDLRRMDAEDLPIQAYSIGERWSGRHWWVFRRGVYSTALSLKALDVRALLLQAENKVKVKLAHAHALMEQAAVLDAPRRPSIPTDVKILVWQRDKGQCVICGSNRDLEFDHVIPLTMGGSNTARNIQLLCELHNRQKGGNLA